MEPLKRNIPLVIAVRAILSTWVWIPTLTLFYLDRGFSLSDLLLFKTALSATALALEIPSGYLADVWGRKKTGILGCIFWLASLLMYCTGSDYVHFLCAEILLGVAASLISGIDSALVFDSLLATGDVSGYRKIEGRLGTVTGFGESIGGLLGAFLASYSLVYPFYAQLVLVVIALCCLQLVVEPPRNQKSPTGVSAWHGISSTVSLVLYRDRGLQSLFLFYGVSGCGTLLLVWLAQGYMAAVQIPVVYFGVVWALLHVVMGFASMGAHALDEWLGPRLTVLLLIFLTVGSFLGLAVVLNPFGLLLIGALYAVRGIRSPLFRYYVNRVVSSDVRATVLSVQAFSVRIFYLIAGPIFALVVERYSLSLAFLLAAVSSLLLLSLAFWRMQVTDVFKQQADTQS